MSDGARRSLDILRERVNGLSGALRAALERRAWQGAPIDGRWAIAGAGGSEGPARVLGALLAEQGRAAGFVPLSSFALERAGERRSGVLVLFSQGLSPNAQLALSQHGTFDGAILFTSVRPGSADDPGGMVSELSRGGGTVVRHGPDDESGLLVRVVGPAVATLLAMALAGELGGAPSTDDLRRAVDRVEPARARARAVLSEIDPKGELALVTAGGYQPLAHGLRWKLLEGLGIPDPPVWDVLQVAHGPFQQFYDRAITLCALELPGSGALFDRLEGMLVPSRHRLLRLRAEAPAPLAWFEHDAMLDELVLGALERAPRDLIDWPGKGRDGHLYRLGPGD